MTPEKIKEVIRIHAAWIRGDSDGRRVDLHGADLHGANLHGADLRDSVGLHYQIPQEGDLIVWKQLVLTREEAEEWS